MTVLNSLITYRQNVGRKVDHFKFRTDLVKRLLVQHSILCGISGHHDGDNTVNRLTECHFPRNLPQKSKPTKTAMCCLQQA